MLDIGLALGTRGPEENAGLRLDEGFEIWRDVGLPARRLFLPGIGAARPKGLIGSQGRHNCARRRSAWRMQAHWANKGIRRNLADNRAKSATFAAPYAIQNSIVWSDGNFLPLKSGKLGRFRSIPSQSVHQISTLHKHR
jgi:hypothetical protein